MKIIDFHCHIYPEKIAEKATQSTGAFYGIAPYTTGTAEKLIDRGSAAGISEYVILPVATKASQVHSVNEFAVAQAAAYDCFHCFGTIHAAMEHPLEETDFILSSGLKGIKLHPDTQRFNIDDERLFPVYDFVSDKCPVLVHCGDPRYTFSRPERMRKVMKLFPKLQVIAAHLGGWEMFDTAYDFLGDTNCFVDISSCMMFLEREQMEKYIGLFGADRVLFGTDFPLWDPVAEVESFMKLSLRDKDREKISYQNAQKILI